MTGKSQQQLFNELSTFAHGNIATIGESRAIPFKSAFFPTFGEIKHGNISLMNK